MVDLFYKLFINGSSTHPQISAAIHGATERSVVLVDEFGKGTSAVRYLLVNFILGIVILVISIY